VDAARVISDRVPARFFASARQRGRGPQDGTAQFGIPAFSGASKQQERRKNKTGVSERRSFHSVDDDVHLQRPNAGPLAGRDGFKTENFSAGGILSLLNLQIHIGRTTPLKLPSPL